MSVRRHGSAPPDLQTDTAGEAWSAYLRPLAQACVWQLDTCTHVTAAQHVLYIDARARQQYYRRYAPEPKVSAVDLVSS